MILHGWMSRDLEDNVMSYGFFLPAKQHEKKQWTKAVYLDLQDESGKLEGVRSDVQSQCETVCFKV